jgi:glutathione S-transferase
MNIRKDYSGFGHTPEVDADIARIATIWADCRERFGAGGAYLMGDWSIADMAFAPVCFRFKTYGVRPEGVAGDYLGAVLAHPHMQEWQEAALAEQEVIAENDIYG